MRIAVFGYGSIGKRHTQNLLAMGETDLFVYDPRIGEKGFTCAPVQGTNSLDMIWDWKPEAVVICAPPVEHFHLALKAIDHGAHCFIEKPVTTTAKQALMLRDLLEVRYAQARIAVGYQLRWQIDGLDPGRLTFECSQDMAQWPSQYEKDALLEFSHEIDAAVHLNGPVERLTASETFYGWHIVLRHLVHTSEIFINPRASSYAREIRNADLRRKVWEFSHEKNDRAYSDELEAFLHVCKGGMYDEKLCTLAQATHVLHVVEACKRSASRFSVEAL